MMGRDAIATVMAEAAIDGAQIEVGNAKLQQLIDALEKRELLSAARVKARNTSDDYKSVVVREMRALERVVKQILGDRATQIRLGIRTLYETVVVSLSEEEQNEEGNEMPASGEAENGSEESTRRVARSRSRSAERFLGRHRQMVAGLVASDEETLQTLLTYGWGQARIDRLIGMGDAFFALHQAWEDSDVQVKNHALVLTNCLREATVWYRSVSQAARDMAVVHPHLGPTLKAMGERY